VTARFYFNDVAAAGTAVTSKNTWTVNNGTPAIAANKQLGLQAMGPQAASANASLVTNVQPGATTAGRTVQVGRWVSPAAINAGSLGGTLNYLIGAYENAAGLNAAPCINVWITDGDSNTQKHAIFNNTSSATTEVGTTNTTSGFASGTLSISGGPYAIAVGDRIVIEVGYRIHTTAGSATQFFSMYYGNPQILNPEGTNYIPTSDAAATDLATTTTNNGNLYPGWVDFSGADGIWSTKFESVSDDFDDNTIGALWPNSYGTYKEEDGMAQVGANQNEYSGIFMERKYSIRNSQLIINLKGVIATSAGSQVWTSLTISSPVTGSSMEHFIDIKNNLMQWRDNKDYSDTGTPASLNYSSNVAALAWLRIREASDILYFETSPTGYDQWTIRRQVNTHGWMRYQNLAVILQAYRNGAETTDYAKWDNFNITPTAPGPSAVRTGAFLHAA